jgi:hypothetical protein
MRRLAPAFTLFFLSPLIAEFFLGDFPIILLPLILLLAPMYGGGALMIRELVRRSHRGWPTIVTLGLAFGVLEEGLLTQSLFNPNYANERLLDPGFIPALGIGVPWTIFVLTLHTVFSISTPIAIVEESARHRRTSPWLGRVGLIVTSALFVVGCVITFAISYGNGDHFLARPAQLGVSAAIAAVLVVIAFRLPRPAAAAGRRRFQIRRPGPRSVAAVRDHHARRCRVRRGHAVAGLGRRHVHGGRSRRDGGARPGVVRPGRMGSLAPVRGGRRRDVHLLLARVHHELGRRPRRDHAQCDQPDHLCVRCAGGGRARRPPDPPNRFHHGRLHRGRVHHGRVQDGRVRYERCRDRPRHNGSDPG